MTTGADDIIEPDGCSVAVGGLAQPISATVGKSIEDNNGNIFILGRLLLIRPDGQFISFHTGPSFHFSLIEGIKPDQAQAGKLGYLY